MCFRLSSNVQLVDLFSPEFNLKIGDLFTKDNHKQLDSDNITNYSEKLRQLVTQRLAEDATIQ